MAAALTFAAPASASSIIDPCSNLTDGTASSCHFSGNINTGTTLNGNSYLDAQNAYNTYAPSQGWAADLVLTPLAEFDSSGASNGITFNGANGSTGGTFTVAAGVDLQYYAVKASNEFMLYEFVGGPGTYDWSTAGLTNKNGDLQGLSHIIFFGGPGGVPEPATWAMMLLGIGMIGSSMRSRRQKQARPVVLA